MNWGDRLKRKTESEKIQEVERPLEAAVISNNGDTLKPLPIESQDAQYERYVKDVGEVEVALPVESESIEVELPVREVKSPLDIDKVLSGLGEGDSATAGIREMGHKGENLPMISNLVRPERVTAVQVHRAFQEHIGLKRRALVRGWLLDYIYMHGAAKAGKDNRAKMMLDSYKVEVEKKFEIDKKSGAQRLM